MTSNKYIQTGIILTAILSSGCHKESYVVDRSWSAPIMITKIKDALVGGIKLYKWHESIMALQELDDNSAKCYLMDSNHDSWSQTMITGVPAGYFWGYPAVDAGSDEACFKQDYMEGDQLEMDMLVGRLAVKGNLVFQNSEERKWKTDVKTILDDAKANTYFTEPGKRTFPALEMNFIASGTRLFVPYSLAGVEITTQGKTLYTDSSQGPFASGLLYSADSGRSWQIQQISGSQAWAPSICLCGEDCYFFGARMGTAGSDELWFSRKLISGDSWGAPGILTATYGYGYMAVSQSDTVHLCWLDSKHEMKTTNPDGSRVGNFELMYSGLKKSDPAPGKPVLLSGDLLYSFSPSMSVDGNKVVIAWAGIQKADKLHSPSDPNDIYYVTSNDGGEHWQKPARITDNIGGGITAGCPQVVLKDGIIHLSYIQGKLILKSEAAGLTKFNQPPWTVFYTQRPFPE